jgi:hypothetical protein
MTYWIESRTVTPMTDDLRAGKDDLPATYLCSISRFNPDNWPLARDAGMWGLTARGGVGTRTPPTARVRPGDRLVFWVGGQGYVGEGVVVEPPRAPKNKSEAPWPGGLHLFQTVIPMLVTKELRSPVYLRFDGDKQRDTNMSKNNFRRSLYRIPDSAAEVISKLISQSPAKE